MRRVLKTITMLIVAVISGLTIQSSQAETIQEVVSEVLKDNPEIIGLSLNRAAIEQEENQARGLGLPDVELFGGVGVGRDDRNFSRDGTSVQGDVGVSLKQKIFDGFEKKNRVKRQKARASSARNRVKDASNIVALQVVRAFIEARRAHAIHAVAQKNVSAHRRIVSRVRQSANAGRGTNTQVQQALAQFEQAKIDEENAKLQILEAQTAFIAVVGRQPRRLEAVKVPLHNYPKTMQRAVDLALTQSPAVRARVFDADAALSAVKVAKAERLPKVDLEVAAFETFNETPGASGADFDAQALLRIRYKLYSGGINKARRREADLRAAEARNEVAITRRTIERDVRLAYAQTQIANKRVALMRSKTRRATRILPDYFAQFDAGRRSLLDILDIQNDIFTNQSAAISEQATANFNRFRILALTGDLVTSIGTELPVAAVKTFHLSTGETDAWKGLR